MLSGLIEKTESSEEKDGEIIDYSSITTIYNDILQVIHNDLEAELGKRVFTLFDECKAELVHKQRDLLKNFDLSSRITTNLQGILEGMASFKGYEEGRTFLVHSFNSLLLALLRKEMKLLGQHITERTIKEVEQTLVYIEEYRKGSSEKSRILQQIQNTLDKARQGFERKK